MPGQSQVNGGPGRVMANGMLHPHDLPQPVAEGSTCRLELAVVAELELEPVAELELEPVAELELKSVSEFDYLKDLPEYLL